MSITARHGATWPTLVFCRAYIHSYNPSRPVPLLEACFNLVFLGTLGEEEDCKYITVEVRECGKVWSGKGLKGP